MSLTVDTANVTFDKAYAKAYDSTIEFFSFDAAADEQFTECLRYMAMARREFTEFIKNLTTYNSDPTEDNLDTLDDSPFTKPPAHTKRFDAFHEEVCLLRSCLKASKKEMPDPFRETLAEIAKLRPAVLPDWKQELIKTVTTTAYYAFPVTCIFHRGVVPAVEYSNFARELGLTVRSGKVHLNAENVDVNGEYAEVKNLLNHRREIAVKRFFSYIAANLKSRAVFEDKNFKDCPVSSYRMIVNRLNDIGVGCRTNDDGSLVFFWKNPVV